MGRSWGRNGVRRFVVALLSVGVCLSLAAFVPTAGAAGPTSAASSQANDARLAADQARTPKKCGRPPLNGCRLVWHGKQAPTLVVWGDSHAWMMTPAVVEAVGSRKVNVVLFFLGGCIPAIPPRSIYTGNACAEVSYSAMRYLKELQAAGTPVRLLLGSFWGANLNRIAFYESEERREILEARRDFTQRYSRPLFPWLGANGIRTDVQVQGPAAVPPTECKLGATPFYCPVRRRHAYFKDTYVRNWLAQRMSHLPAGARLVDYTKGICSPTNCRAIANGVHTWFDPYHVSATKAATLGGYYKPTVRALLNQRKLNQR